MFVFFVNFSCFILFAIAVHSRIGSGGGNGNGGDIIGIGAGVGQPVIPPQIQPQQPAQPQAAALQQPLRLPSVDRDTNNNAGNNYPAEENKCFKVSVSFDR